MNMKQTKNLFLKVKLKLKYNIINYFIQSEYKAN
jgi:hypothetical protein